MKKQQLRVLLSRNQLDELMIGGGSGGGSRPSSSAPSPSGGNSGAAFAGLRIA